MTFHLHLIRHGQSANNALPESQRVEDPRLTEEGVRQAESLASSYRSGRITHLLTSGFLRAIETTLPLAEVLKLRPKIWIGLHEVGGCYAGYEPGQEVGRPGMNRETLAAEYSDFELPDELDERGWWRSKAYESWEDARLRAQAQVARLMSEFSATNAQVACVIHADFKALMLETLVPAMFSELSPADLKNTGVTILKCASDKSEVVQFNRTEHLQ